MRSLRAVLKRNAVAYALNARIKGAAFALQSMRLRRHYERLLCGVSLDGSDATVRCMALDGMRRNGVRPIAEPPGSMHIFCVGTDYEQESAGFLQGLDRMGVLTLLRDRHGGYGLEVPARLGDRAAIEANDRAIIEQVEAAHARRKVDVLIGTMNAQRVSLRALREVRRRGIPVVNMAMDDRLPEHWGSDHGRRLGAIGLAPETDLVLQTTPEYVVRYLAEGVPIAYSPLASDPNFFAPSAVKDYDVVFVGNKYGWRVDVIRALIAAGIRVECFGSGFPNGHISARQTADVLNRAKIVLGVGTVGHSKRTVTLKLRDFDGPMSGGLYITTQNPDLDALYEVGREIETYGSIDECIRKIRYYLANDAARQQIATAGRRRAAAEHTWVQRLERAFRLLAATDEAR